MDATTGPAGGNLVTPGPTPAFAEVSRRVAEAGLMRPRPGYYAAMITANLLLLGAGWAAFALAGNSWWQVAVAVYLGWAFTQTDFIGHDAGHGQITRSRRKAEILGLLHGNLLTGVSFGWWVGHHTQHHNYPNHLSLDPDILRRQVAFSAAQDKAGRNGFIIRHQSWMFFVLIMMEGLRLHLAGFIAARRGAIKRNAWLDLTLAALHLVAYFAAVCYLLPPLKAVAFLVVHQAVYGCYMGVAFAPNHKGLPVRDGADDELDWLTRQVTTSRNLRSTLLTDMLFGGLNYQIEHHVFPGMPRVNLRRARPIVRDFCLSHGLPYAEVPVSESYRQVSRHLGSVSAQVRQAAAARAGNLTSGVRAQRGIQHRCDQVVEALTIQRGHRGERIRQLRADSRGEQLAARDVAMADSRLGTR
jgi:fatty acid desaturase